MVYITKIAANLLFSGSAAIFVVRLAVRGRQMKQFAEDYINWLKKNH